MANQALPANVRVNIIDRTSASGMTERALSILNSAAASAAALGLTLEITAARGGGHKSHGSGTEWDLKGYEADGSLWTPEQRVYIAQGAKEAGADRFGLYSFGKGFTGNGSLHVGYSGKGRPASVWGFRGNTSGEASRKFVNPAEQAFLGGRKLEIENAPDPFGLEKLLEGLRQKSPAQEALASIGGFLNGFSRSPPEDQSEVPIDASYTPPAEGQSGATNDRVTAAEGVNALGRMFTNLVAPKPEPVITDPKRDAVIRTVWGEAGGEGENGLTAVAAAIVNRTRDQRFPADAFEVVSQPNQFDGYDSKLAKGLSPDDPEYQKIDQILTGLEDGSVPDPINGATHFHAEGVSPDWAKKLEYTNQVGNHLFYDPVRPREEVEAAASDVLAPYPKPHRDNALPLGATLNGTEGALGQFPAEPPPPQPSMPLGPEAAFQSSSQAPAYPTYPPPTPEARPAIGQPAFTDPGGFLSAFSTQLPPERAQSQPPNIYSGFTGSGSGSDFGTTQPDIYSGFTDAGGGRSDFGTTPPNVYSGFSPLATPPPMREPDVYSGFTEAQAPEPEPDPDPTPSPVAAYNTPPPEQTTDKYANILSAFSIPTDPLSAIMQGARGLGAIGNVYSDIFGPKEKAPSPPADPGFKIEKASHKVDAPLVVDQAKKTGFAGAFGPKPPGSQASAEGQGFNLWKVAADAGLPLSHMTPSVNGQPGRQYFLGTNSATGYGMGGYQTPGGTNWSWSTNPSQQIGAQAGSHYWTPGTISGQNPVFSR